MHDTKILTFLLAVPGALFAQQFQVVPAAHATLDAVAFQWIAGASRDVRQQTLVGGSHLQSLLGRSITALELRRSAAAEPFAGGTAQLTVTLSTSPRAPLGAADVFAQNVGNDAITAFSGTVALPASPAAVGPNVPWTPANTVRIALTQPFVYQGGTLCIDVVGTALAGQTADWWMADAEFEDLSGTTQEIGAGCGLFGGAGGRWSHVNARSLLVGAHAQFWAQGPANGFAAAVFGLPGAPIPLAAFQLQAPGCACHLLPSSILAAVVLPFVPDPDPRLAARGGIAELRLPVPNTPASLSLSLATQWFEFSQPATSNAIAWSICGVAPTLDMALVEGHPASPRGNVSVHLAHVWRIEHH